MRVLRTSISLLRHTAFALVAPIALAQTYVSYEHCKRDLDQAKRDAMEATAKVDDCSAAIHQGTKFSCKGVHGAAYGATLNRLGAQRDEVHRRKDAIASACSDLQRAEREAKREADVQALRQRQAEQLSRSQESRLPDNHLLRQQEIQRRQDVASERARAEAAANSRATADAAFRSAALGIVGRMAASGIGLGIGVGKGNETYDRAHDARDKLQDQIQKANPDRDKGEGVVSRIQDAASDELRRQNQQTLGRLNEFSSEFARFGAGSDVKNPWVGPSPSSPSSGAQPHATPSANPWATSSGQTVPQPAEVVAASNTPTDRQYGQVPTPQRESFTPARQPDANPWAGDRTASAATGLPSPPIGYAYVRRRPGQPPQFVSISEARTLGGDVDAPNGACTSHGMGFITLRCEELRNQK